VEIAALWLALWPQPDGLACEKIFRNLRLAIDEEIQRIDRLQQPSSEVLKRRTQLLSWRSAIDAIQAAFSKLASNVLESMGQLPANTQDGKKSYLPDQETHPLTRRGLTAHSIYSAFWNCHESTQDQYVGLSENAMKDGQSLRRLQLLCLQIQAHLIDDYAINLQDYEQWFQKDCVVEPESGKKSYNLKDYFSLRDADKLYLPSVGHALRALSWEKHQSLLKKIEKCFADDENETLEAISKLDLPVLVQRAKNPKDADEAKKEKRRREAHSIINALRGLARKVLDDNFYEPRKKKKRGKRRKGKHQIESGYIGKSVELIPIKPPEDLPEFEGWVPAEEVGGVDIDELKSGDDTEAPKRSGLTLIKPADIAGKLAKLKSQQHHLAVLRQSFGWDASALADSEKQCLNDLVNDLKQTAATEVPALWIPRALVAVSWLLGRTLAEVEQLRVVSALKFHEVDCGLAVSQTTEGFFWSIPLRLPADSRKEFSKQLNRVDWIEVPDISGLGAAILEMYKRRGLTNELFFAWANPPKRRIELATEELKKLDASAGDLARISPAFVARSLCIELLNLVPDRTIAWMIAGTRQNAVEARMFYAAHTPTELVNWTLTAQIKLLSLSAVQAPTCQMQTLTTFITGQTENEGNRVFGGARFMPKIERLQTLCMYLRHFAQQIPPDEVRERDFGVDIADVHATRKRPVRNVSHPFPFWDTIGCWRLWNDDVVMWVWLVQSLQTGMRAVDNPSGLYYQWLLSPDHPWVSPEDKTTRDHDESRAILLTPLLRDAFQALTAMQEAYAHRWKPSPSQKKRGRKRKISPVNPLADMPVGFVVFDGGDKPRAMKSNWACRRIKRTIGADWPSNFSRALLRRALAERGLSGDDLDAFLGHGALADRVHDGHSLFEPMPSFDRINGALSDFSDSVGLHKLNHRIHLDPGAKRYRTHREHALVTLKSTLNAAGIKPSKAGSSKKERTSFDEWCDTVSVLTDEKAVNLARLRDWFAVIEKSKQPFAQFLLHPTKAPVQQSLPLPTFQSQIDVAVVTPIESESLVGPTLVEQKVPPVSQGLTQADADLFERELISAFMGKDSKLKRTDTAYGFNVAYQICRKINPAMPTMKVALTPAAKVSPYTLERIRSAATANEWLTNCRQQIRARPGDGAGNHSTTDPAIELALASFLNVTTNKPRWMSLAQTSTEAADAHRVEQRPFAVPFEYRLKGLGKKDRQFRGFMDPVSFNLRPLNFPFVEKPSVDFQRMKPKIAKRPRDLGAWVTGLRWWSRLRLPPLVAEHFAGVLDDQCASGPWGEQFAGANSRKFNVVQDVQLKFVEQCIVPPLVERDIDADPFGWSPDLPYADTAAGKWLRSCLAGELGGDPNAGPEDLSEALDEAMYIAPSSYRRRLKATIAKICKNHGLDNEADSESGVLHVERQVIDLETYHRLLDDCAQACIRGRFPDRQSRLRLLLVLGFRFGMRRREILGLRRIDVDLIGSGRIHIRPYQGHTLKTNFSRRCLPIAPLLPQPEREFLAAACQGLDPLQTIFPDHEHDTLARDAIARLRSVSGDDSLKLHHLRHSFASLLALKLVLARHPQWIGAFAPWPQTTAELLASQNLIGSLIKPLNAAGDCFVIPRLLGHSSLQVSLTHYTHTLDIASALFQCHGLSKEVLADRDVGPLIHKRFKTALQIRENALVWPPGSLAQFTPHANLPMTLTRSQRLDKTLIGWYERCKEGEPANAVLPQGLTLQALGNWFSPRQAGKLQERLILASDKLTDDDVDLLARLGDLYWQVSPPMFWFSQARCKPGDDAGTVMVNDAVALIKLLRKCDFKPGDLVTWRYAKAAEKAHEKFWRPALAAAGLPRQCQQRSGRSSNTECLGISLSSGSVKRTELLLVWWLGLKQGLGLSDCSQ